MALYWPPVARKNSFYVPVREGSERLSLGATNRYIVNSMVLRCMLRYLMERSVRGRVLTRNHLGAALPSAITWEVAYHRGRTN
jgi:hypothetical protein